MDKRSIIVNELEALIAEFKSSLFTNKQVIDEMLGKCFDLKQTFNITSVSKSMIYYIPKYLLFNCNFGGDYELFCFLLEIENKAGVFKTHNF